MAYTRIHAIRATVGKAVTYICNKEKTDSETLISAHDCSPRTAESDFKLALSQAGTSGKIIAYHLIQSFAPGEVTEKEAHAIGEELARELLKNEYSYIVATHVNTESYHNHVIFCAVNNVTHRKFNSCKKTYRQIRNISDRICAEHRLSVILEKGKNEAVSKEHTSPFSQRTSVPSSESISTTSGFDQNSGSNQRALWNNPLPEPSWRDIIRNDIDAAVQNSSDYGTFLEFMKAKGYEIKGEYAKDARSGTTAKYISFRPLLKERFVRGSEKSLGIDYTRERILERIECRNLAINSKKRLEAEHSTEDFSKTDSEYTAEQHRTEYQNQLPNGTANIISANINTALPPDLRRLLNKQAHRQNPEERFHIYYTGYRSSRMKLINLETEKFQNSPGLQNWGKRQNLKLAASVLAAYGSLTALNEKIAEKTAVRKEVHNTLITTDRQIARLKEILKYAERYRKYRKYHEQFEQANDKEQFLQRYEDKIILFDGAYDYLVSSGISPEKLNIQKLQEQLENLKAVQASTREMEKTTAGELKDLQAEQAVISEYLSSASDQKIKRRQPGLNRLNLE